MIYAEQACVLKEDAIQRISESKKVEKIMKKIGKKIIKHSDKGYGEYSYSFPLFTNDHTKEVVFKTLNMYGYLVDWGIWFDVYGKKRENYRHITIKW